MEAGLSSATETRTTSSSRSASASDTLLAIRNALKLGGSLIFTWSIAIVMKLVLPRSLGPSDFGAFTFADAFVATFFVALGLGVDVYVRKEVTVRWSHASDFFGGTVVLRVLGTGVLLLVMSLVMSLTNRTLEVRLLVYAFAIANFFVTMNATLSALLHARGEVSGMSILSVASKVLWAGWLVASLVFHARLWVFAGSLLVSEALECAALYVLARKHLDLSFHLDGAATKAMIVSSLPFYLNAVACTAYGKLDVSWLAFVAPSSEVGFYAGASSIAALTLFATPLIGWVLMPAFAKARQRSRADLDALLRRSTELILTVAIPVSLMVGVGADEWIRILFGAAYAPATLALRILAPTFVITYVAIVYATTLLMIERAWTLTGISCAGLVVNIGLNALFDRHAIELLGPGGGGAGCGLAMLGTELFVTASMISVLGVETFDTKTLAVLAKSLGACGVVVVAHLSLAPIGPARLVVDLALYLGIVIVAGALRPREIKDVLGAAIHREGAPS